jgi:hypothetical protein
MLKMTDLETKEGKIHINRKELQENVAKSSR